MSRRRILPVVQTVSLSYAAGQFRNITLWFLLLAALVLPLGAFAAQSGDLPARSDIQSQIEALNKQKNLTPVEKLSLQDLTRTMELLDGLERTKQELNQLKQQVQQAPAKLQQVTRDLESLKNPADEAVTRAELLPLSLRQLESRLYQTLDELQDTQESLLDLQQPTHLITDPARTCAK
ncbi:Potassium efflux system KefA precursor [Serratia fonticola]|uniref:Potassium efflux system KefA n=1 Tax=Serratia fonticola TaxID=47917 RepID=A0A4U9VCQ1_SERFO|nr:Potassium efflux system KefA precursor [Serratia fonticola]